MINLRQKITDLYADRSPFMALALMWVAMQLSFAAWHTLIRNFGVDVVGMNGAQIGLQETVREIPGFLAFLVIYLLLFVKEQRLALLSLVLLAVGVAISGSLASLWGIYLTTFIMSLGFHYFETTNQSLQLQWLDKQEAPQQLGRLLAIGAATQLVVFGILAVVWQRFDIGFQTMFAAFGLAALVIVAYVWRCFPQFAEKNPQHKKLIIRKRYWLYYALVFMSGARRQVFMVFASLLMVERFGFDVHEIAALFLVNCLFNMYFAPKIGRLIAKFGERNILRLEYIGLVGVFVAYAFVDSPAIAIALYLIDHMFFAMAIALKTYLQKIADPADLAGTAGVSFTINHIAAVIIPVVFGLLWLSNPAMVFLLGAGMAMISFGLSFLVPRSPSAGNEALFAPGWLAAK